MVEGTRSTTPKPNKLVCENCGADQSIRYDQTHKFNYLCPKCGSLLEADSRKEPGAY